LSKNIAAPAMQCTIGHDTTRVKTATRHLQGGIDKFSIWNLVRKEEAGGSDTQLRIAVATPTI
jgi:hypothetical protein